MNKNLSYRDKLLELAKIYKIAEIKSYLKDKKYLTTPQLEHILKKNKITIPTEVNKSILEIQAKKITKPIYSTGNRIGNFFSSTLDAIVYFFVSSVKGILKFFVMIGVGIVKFCSFVNKSTISILNGIHNFKFQSKLADKIVSLSMAFVFLFLIVTGGFYIKSVLKEANFDQVKLEKEVTKPKLKQKESKKIIKTPKDKPKDKIKAPENKVAKIPEKPKQKKSEKVTEFVLPNLNLKTETVLNLFEDVQYDLKKVRYEKKVKPIYFTQFPKDLDEISNVKLKKETFIKIVLPLVVAENQKILNDKSKLEKIVKRKNQTEKQKLWLNQKFKEYKINDKNLAELDRRMDIIPISIALAQAAKESGWGTSRFALEGNAIFGQWTWDGSGIAPLDRSKEKKHKILRFPILRASVKAYKNNINTHKGYKEFRKKRFQLRKKNRQIAGLQLIHSLDRYAQTGQEYTKTLEKIILQNSLAEFENVMLTNSVVKKELNL